MAPDWLKYLCLTRVSKGVRVALRKMAAPMRRGTDRFNILLLLLFIFILIFASVRHGKKRLKLLYHALFIACFRHQYLMENGLNFNQ